MGKTRKTALVTITIVAAVPILIALVILVRWKYEVAQIPEPYKSAVERSCSPFNDCGCLDEAKKFVAENTPIPNPNCPEGYSAWYPMCKGLAYCAKKTNTKPSVGSLNE